MDISFDENWLFHRGDADGAQAPSFEDSSWRQLDVPHDWRIEDLPHAVSDDGAATANPSLFAFHTIPSPDGPAPDCIGPFDVNADPEPDADFAFPGIGKIVMAGGRGQAYTADGIGWYRKHFSLPASAPYKDRVTLRFDGVFQNADFWLNGVHLGFHPNGYSSFAFDLTPHLNPNGDNVLAVRVDNRGKTSRWYTGSGIYRHTWLTLSAAVNIPLWGVHITTPLAEPRRSNLHADVKVANTGAVAADVSVRLTVLDARGQSVATQSTAARPIQAGQTETHSASIAIDGAALWSPEAPNLYSLRAELVIGGQVVDSNSTAFGIRTLLFDRNGFKLNGKTYKLCGGNIHHDHGPLGSVAIDRAEERTVEVMKAIGFNAIRAAHNPPAPALLDACDRLGILVLEEFTDQWDTPKTRDDYHRYFPEWWERDLTAMMLRDRNHPCVISWSVGNEISTDPNGYGARLAALIRSFDTTRPVAQGGMNVGPRDQDIWSYVDIGDFHGEPPAETQAAHADKTFLQSENTPPRMYDNWKLAQDHDWYAGSWVWSGWDYMGESGSGAPILKQTFAEAEAGKYGPVTGKIPYPWYTNAQGDIDLIGQRKPQNYWRAVIEGWSQLEVMVERPTPEGVEQFAVGYSYYDELQSWTWDVPQGQPMKIHVYTRGDAVTLLLNGKEIATKSVLPADKRVAAFVAPYAPGELIAIASREGREIARQTLTTTGAPAAIRLTSDVQTLSTSRSDLAHVLVEIVDADGRAVPDAVLRVDFTVEGDGELVGVANGNPHNVDSFKRPRRWTWHGQALAILRPAKQSGSVSLSATAPGLKSASVTLPVAFAKQLV